MTGVDGKKLTDSEAAELAEIEKFLEDTLDEFFEDEEEEDDTKS